MYGSISRSSMLARPLPPWARYARASAPGPTPCGAITRWSLSAPAVLPRPQLSANIPWHFFSEGAGGPFEKLYNLNCQVLLLGVGFNRCTALHFAESLVDRRRVKTLRFPVLDKGQRVWMEVPNVADDNGAHFPVVGQEYVAEEGVRQGKIGDAASMLFPMRNLVDFAVRYFEDAL